MIVPVKFVYVCYVNFLSGCAEEVHISAQTTVSKKRRVQIEAKLGDRKLKPEEAGRTKARTRLIVT